MNTTNICQRRLTFFKTLVSKENEKDKLLVTEKEELLTVFGLEDFAPEELDEIIAQLKFISSQIKEQRRELMKGFEDHVNS